MYSTIRLLSCRAYHTTIRRSQIKSTAESTPGTTPEYQSPNSGTIKSGSPIPI